VAVGCLPGRRRADAKPGQKAGSDVPAADLHGRGHGQSHDHPDAVGRLDVADDELVVRCRLVPVFRPRSVARSVITAVALDRRWGRDRLTVSDIEGAFSAVAVALQSRADAAAVIDELRRRGYPVVDRR